MANPDRKPLSFVDGSTTQIPGRLYTTQPPRSPAPLAGVEGTRPQGRRGNQDRHPDRRTEDAGAEVDRGDVVQPALQIGASDTAFGDDFDTILGAEVSPAKDRELTDSTVKVVTVELHAFGYNDAGSAAITAAASVVAVRV